MDHLHNKQRVVALIVYLLPVQTYANPNGHDLVMTEVQAADHTTHPSNLQSSSR